MKGDFSRSSFDPRKHYRSVRMQQGRVQLDADWNEQADILLYLIQTQLNDVLGPSATAATERPGLAVSLVEPAEQPADQTQAGQPEGPTPPDRPLPDFQIEAGRYYVDGMLCENEAPVLFSRQPDYPFDASLLQELAGCNRLLVYLDVWQRHITAAEDPAIREIALGGPDTSTRVKTVWQVKLLPLSGDPPDEQGWRDRGGLRSLPDWQAFVAQASQDGLLKARWDRSKGRAPENHLYRVEIHSVAGGQVTFKWSRENGSVVFPITKVEDGAAADGQVTFKWSREEGLATPPIIALDPSPAPENAERTLRVTAEGLDRDPYQLEKDSWVELVDDVIVLSGRPLPLCRVKEPVGPEGEVTLYAQQHGIDQILSKIGARELHHPLLRRWECRVGPITHPGNAGADQGERWWELEHGIQVSFSSEAGSYEVGDYWLIPARTRSEEGIEWPQKDGRPLAQAPRGIRHHYAPLALLEFQDGRWSVAAEESPAFGSLPRITADLSQLRAEYSRLREVPGTVDAFVRRTEVVETALDKVLETVDTLVRRTQVFVAAKSEEPLEKGDLVSLDRVAAERLDLKDSRADLPIKRTRSTERNRQLVVGVVTGQMDDQRYLVALCGRACCKVIGSVNPGDLLTPSGTDGCACRRRWYQWRVPIIGKALTAWHSDGKQPGAVEMLVTLG